MIVGLCGYARAGKNTLADLIETHCGYKQIAFADALKNVAYGADPLLHPDGTTYRQAVDRYGTDGIKSTKYGPEYRRFLQNLGTQGVRDNMGEGTWVDIVKNRITDGGNWTVTDCRFANEVSTIRDSGGLVVWVHRPGVTAANGHESEHSVSETDCDFTIYNMSTPSDMVRQFKEAIDRREKSLV